MGQIEVRELIIRATVLKEGNEQGAKGEGTASDNNNTSPNEEMIKTCVEKVLEILKDKDGR
jgi:Family of unknown function (DUF5908)